MNAWRRLLTLLALLASALAAQTLTTVSGTVRDAGGNAITGSGTATPVKFTDVDGARVLGGAIPFTITGGALSVALSPNVGATPAGTFYAVEISSTDRLYRSLESWVVPDTGTATIAAVTVSTPPIPSASIQATQIVPGIDGQFLSTVAGAAAWASLTGAGIANCDSPSEVTIASGGITLAASACYLVDTELDAASDDLTAINCAAGVRAILQSASDSRTVVVKAAGADIHIAADFALDNQFDRISLVCPSTDVVAEVGRSSGGP